ncbi:hypothetical protein MKK64_01940 [Methylobacterium sp. E-025]|uniref:hypothetical protein n=1 Tax=Methylobacterium sp. E-025 TaxID=2836561 RepID=UPI001FBB3DD7|nr:hypothetical protein [Methylobacterium sp. E-025]MCJ2109984.1 hypothetical protein [Methylobacterium sp. E-025]
MNRVMSRLVAIAVAVVLIISVRLLEMAGLEYAFEDCAVAAFVAAAVVAVADLKS